MKVSRRVATASVVVACATLSCAVAAGPRGPRWGVSTIQGRREYQEDRFIAGEDGLFAVFDGHGGALASETARRRFGEHFRRLHPRRDAAPDKWLEVFRATEESYRNESRGVPDSAGSKRGEGREGSTACAAYLSPSRLLSVANAGDSRCVVCLKNGQAKAMSVDHKPTDPEEYSRLTANGYTVRRGRIYEVSTGKGGLNLSRAIGDLMYREGVTCTPDVTTLQLDDTHDIAILASDGLWDDLSNEAACKVARGISDLDKAASALVAEAYALGSQDNITALVVDLKKRTD